MRLLPRGDFPPEQAALLLFCLPYLAAAGHCSGAKGREGAGRTGPSRFLPGWRQTRPSRV